MVALLAIFSKLIIQTENSLTYVSSLVIILGISNYFNYYFAMPHRLLLKVDQKIRISQFFQLISIILNAVVCIILIRLGAGIHAVKAATGIIFLIPPFAILNKIKKYKSDRG